MKRFFSALSISCLLASSSQAHPFQSCTLGDNGSNSEMSILDKKIVVRVGHESLDYKIRKTQTQGDYFTLIAARGNAFTQLFAQENVITLYVNTFTHDGTLNLKIFADGVMRTNSTWNVSCH